MTDFAKLREPFPEQDIEWRLQSAGEKNGRIWARVLAYVTVRAIQQRLDEVCGPENWRNEYAPAPAGGVMCGISIHVEGRGWITKWDGSENTDIEAVKGGLSSAMKRAAVQWGIGRYLYDLEEGFGEVRDGGRFHGKANGKGFRWDPPALPAWALPAPETEPKMAAALRALAEKGTEADRKEVERRIGEGLSRDEGATLYRELQARLESKGDTNGRGGRRAA